ncbi:hypothetical protein DFJ74DRAFT_666742 [Hyaloraphidium curvatum]|nr:hypothetical protein DFJ74DRAFT_666742 [Hyaloraphidium curvatum]
MPSPSASAPPPPAPLLGAARGTASSLAVGVVRHSYSADEGGASPVSPASAAPSLQSVGLDFDESSKPPLPPSLRKGSPAAEAVPFLAVPGDMLAHSPNAAGWAKKGSDYDVEGTKRDRPSRRGALFLAAGLFTGAILLLSLAAISRPRGVQITDLASGALLEGPASAPSLPATPGEAPPAPQGTPAVHGKDDDLTDIADRYAGSAYRGPGMVRPEEMKHEEEEHMTAADGDHAKQPAAETDEDEAEEGRKIAQHEEEVRLRHAVSTPHKRHKRSTVPRTRNRRRQPRLETAFEDSLGVEVLQLADDVPRGWGPGIRRKVAGRMSKEEGELWVVEAAES